MIRLIDWLFGKTPVQPQQDTKGRDQRTAELDRQNDEAAAQHVEAREFRRRAEVLGPQIRRQLAENHFGERMSAALHQRGWKP